MLSELLGDAQPGHFGQQTQQLFRNPIRKVTLFRIRAHVHKRQYRDGVVGVGKSFIYQPDNARFHMDAFVNKRIFKYRPTLL